MRTGAPDLTWARFDVPGWTTVYGADQRVGAVLETLAYAAPDRDLDDLESLFPDGAGPSTLLDVLALTRPDRALTCSLDWWLTSQELPDGSRPAGVRYPSSHGTDQQAFALWTGMGRFSPATEVADAVSMTIDTVTSAQFSNQDPDLLAAARMLEVTVF